MMQGKLAPITRNRFSDNAAQCVTRTMLRIICPTCNRTGQKNRTGQIGQMYVFFGKFLNAHARTGRLLGNGVTSVQSVLLTCRVLIDCISVINASINTIELLSRFAVIYCDCDIR